MDNRPEPPDHRPLLRRRRRRTLAAAAGALLLAASLAVAGCDASSHDSASDAAPNIAQNRAGGAPQSGGPADSASGAKSGANSGTGATSGSTGSNGSSSGRKTPAPAPSYLVRTADISVRTPHVADQLTKARQLAVAAGGYSGDENTTTDSRGSLESTVQLRVPPAAYDKLLDDLAALGTQLSRKVSVEDVTGQVVDVDSRIKTQQASVARVRKLMDQAGSIADVVSLENELTTRESALESLEAQQASLRSRTDLATVTLHLTPPPAKPAAPKPAKKHDGFWQSVGNALGGGWHAFYLTVRGVLVVVSAILPFLALALLAWFAFRLVRRWWPRSTPVAGDDGNTLLGSLLSPRTPDEPGTAADPGGPEAPVVRTGAVPEHPRRPPTEED
jgi:hypothetical protein